MSEYEPEVVLFSSATVVFGIDRVYVIEPALLPSKRKYRGSAFRTRDEYVNRLRPEGFTTGFAGFFYTYSDALNEGKKYVAQDWEVRDEN